MPAASIGWGTSSMSSPAFPTCRASCRFPKESATSGVCQTTASRCSVARVRQHTATKGAGRDPAPFVLSSWGSALGVLLYLLVQVGADGAGDGVLHEGDARA